MLVLGRFRDKACLLIVLEPCDSNQTLLGEQSVLFSSSALCNSQHKLHIHNICSLGQVLGILPRSMALHAR